MSKNTELGIYEYAVLGIVATFQKKNGRGPTRKEIQEEIMRAELVDMVTNGELVEEDGKIRPA